MMRINTDVESSHSAQDLSKAETLQKFGLFFQKMGELDLAVSVYQRVLDLGADSSDLRFNYGAARLKQIRPTEALNHFKAAARRQPRQQAQARDVIGRDAGMHQRAHQKSRDALIPRPLAARRFWLLFDLRLIGHASTDDAVAPNW